MSNFTVGKPEKPYLSWVTKVNNSGKAYRYDVMRMVPYLGVLPAKNIGPQSNDENNNNNNHKQISIIENSTKFLAKTPQNFQGHPKQGSSEKLSSPNKA